MPTEYPAEWTCTRTMQQFESYLLNTLRLAESLSVAEHLEACEACAQRIVIVRLTLTVPARG